MANNDLDANFIPALHKPPALLPIAKHRDSILYTIETYPVTIIIARTGSGKTTQIPQFLEQAGWCNEGKIVGVTQPRRVAATTVALRVADEVGCEVGKKVGYSIRFEDVTSESTRIKFLTDGLLIREALVDPLLSRYSVIMVDEAHERSISTDVLLGLLKKIRRKRPELRIIISSATPEAQAFLDFFSSGSEKPSDGVEVASKIGTVMILEGQTFSIDLMYSETPVENYVDKAISTVIDIHTQEGEGDILVFLTGREEIDFAVQAISERAPELEAKYGVLQPMPLYAGLTTEEQMYVFDSPPKGTRKVILSTNIAEASVTISGIVFVVDCGFVKLRAYNPKTGIESLVTTPISKASAAQRAGRAGRTKPGKCLRLYTEESYRTFAPNNLPEIQRSNLAPTVLQLKALGIDNVVRFEWFSAPPSQLVGKALEFLFSLGALDDYAKLTRPLGMRMAELAGVEPMMAKTLLSAASFGCTDEMLTIAAMTSLGTSVWFHHEGERQAMESARRRFAAEEGDHLTLLNAYQAFVTRGRRDARFCRDNHLNHQAMTRAVSIRAQLKRHLERFEGHVATATATASADKTAEDGAGRAGKTEAILRCLTSGYFAHAARMQADGTFRNVEGGTVLHAHPSSLLFGRRADWVVFHEVIETSDKTYIRDVSKTQKEWLLGYAPDFYRVTKTRAAA